MRLRTVISAFDPYPAVISPTAIKRQSPDIVQSGHDTARDTASVVSCVQEPLTRNKQSPGGRGRRARNRGGRARRAFPVTLNRAQARSYIGLARAPTARTGLPCRLCGACRPCRAVSRCRAGPGRAGALPVVGSSCACLPAAPQRCQTLYVTTGLRRPHTPAPALQYASINACCDGICSTACRIGWAMPSSRRRRSRSDSARASG